MEHVGARSERAVRVACVAPTGTEWLHVPLRACRHRRRRGDMACAIKSNKHTKNFAISWHTLGGVCRYLYLVVCSHFAATSVCSLRLVARLGCRRLLRYEVQLSAVMPFCTALSACQAVAICSSSPNRPWTAPPKTIKRRRRRRQPLRIRVQINS